MAPILLNAAASVAGNVIDSISEHFSHKHGVRKAEKVADQDFDAELAKAQPTATATATDAGAAATAADMQGALMNQLLGSPEVSTALAGANPAKPVQVEMSATGAIALRNANGDVKTLQVSDNTRDLVTKLYSAHQTSVTPGAKAAAVAVLAVDPANKSAAEWSKLPVRT